MRFLYVVSDPGISLRGTKGASVHVRELGSALTRLGHELLWAVARADGDEALPTAGVVVAAPAPSPASEVRAVRAARAVYDTASGPATEYAPDAVYERLSLFGSAGVRLARSLGVPLLVEVNAPLVDESLRHRGLAAAGRARAVEHTVLRSADRVLAVSEPLRVWLMRDGVDPARVSVLPNAVDAGRFAPGTGSREQARRALALGDETSIGFVGTLKPWHDVAGLVRAAGLLARAGRRLTLVVVGDGPERQALEGLARREGVRARFAGAVPHPRVAELLAGIDVGVVPYLRPDIYFSPLKLFEYLAAGVPVVAADAGDVRCCLASGRGGALYTPGDDLSLAAALESLLAHPERARALAASGRHHVLARHTWERNARTVVALAQAAAVGRLRSAA